MGLKTKISLGLIAALAGIVSVFPAQPILKAVAADVAPVTAVGTLWSGQILGAPGFGPVTYAVSPKAFFTGKPPLTFSTQSSGISISGQAASGALSDVKFAGKVWTFSGVDPRLSGLSGDFTADIESLQFDAGNLSAGCLSATGRARTNVLAANRSQWSWAGPDLEGPISCKDGALIVDLRGQDAGGDIAVTVKILPDGTYTGRAVVDTQVPAARSVMALFGFSQSGNRFTLSESGSWQ